MPPLSSATPIPRETMQAAIRLWFSAWQNRPAGSLPGDAAPPPAAGFVLGADGRLYQPELARAATEQQAERTLAVHERVEELETGAQGVNIVTLRRGWTFTPGQDHRIIGEGSLRRLLETVDQSEPFAGPFED